jgi:NAD(P)-dependent dehydrogenase (short-subunit alcohol dehydrogenase family)
VAEPRLVLVTGVPKGIGRALATGLAARVKASWRQRLQPFKVPVKVSIIDDRQYSERFKKTRIFDA